MNEEATTVGDSSPATGGAPVAGDGKSDQATQPDGSNTAGTPGTPSTSAGGTSSARRRRHRGGRGRGRGGGPRPSADSAGPAPAQEASSQGGGAEGVSKTEQEGDSPLRAATPARTRAPRAKPVSKPDPQAEAEAEAQNKVRDQVQNQVKEDHVEADKQPTAEGENVQRLAAPRRRSPSASRPARSSRAGASQTSPKSADQPESQPESQVASVAPETVGDVADASSTTTGTPSTGARRRRRRGGRGRGGRPGGEAAGQTSEEPQDISPPVPDDIFVWAEETAPVGDTPATQREDAMPDSVPSGRGRRRRRASSGSKATPEAKTDAEQQPAAQPKKRLSVEEQVAAGGPTRGLRSTRSRTGREGGGRRRREPVILPPRITDKLMVITEHGDRDQIAVLEEDALVQHYVTRTGAKSMVGCVYMGRVQNVLPGMEAAFVDIGRGRNGVLYAGEVNYRAEDLEGPAPRIEQVLKNGQAVMVQVTKDPMGGKGARLTAQISMPGRYLVLAPNQSLSGISRRLPDEERQRLKAILKKIKPADHGVIVRTAAEGAGEEAIAADLQRLIRGWDEIQKTAKHVKAPDVLYEEPELTVRVVRDLFTDEEFKGLVTDSPRVYEKIMAYVRDIAPDLESKVVLHTGKLPAFEEHRIVEQIHKALDKKVWLPSGGYLFIERTEAMTIIDVNTGKSVGKTNLEETVVNTNLEAAKEVARQLRLRDIGGIIVIDFIDMLLEKNKKQVEDTMRDALAVDKTRSQVFEIGPLGLMQVTRKRVSGGLVESFSETCPTCEGRGILINYEP